MFIPPKMPVHSTCGCVVLFLVTLNLVVVGIHSQFIPHEPPGFLYKEGKKEAPVLMEAFMDLLCPQSKQAYPTLKAIAEGYGPDSVRFVFHLFPLPFHTFAFTAAKSVFVAESCNSSHIFPWIETVLESQGSLSNYQVMDKTSNDVVSYIASLGVQLGLNPATLKEGLSTTDPKFDWPAITAWKYGCSRAVYGTPTVFLNGVLINYALPSWTLQQWRAVIDPLFTQA